MTIPLTDPFWRIDRPLSETLELKDWRRSAETPLRRPGLRTSRDFFKPSERMEFNVPLGITAGLWVLGVVACVFALRWSFSQRRRFIAAIIASLAALLIGYLGMTQLHITASKSVNGQVQWRFDSRWLFMALLLLAAFTLACGVWKRGRMGREKVISESVKQ